MFCQGPHLAKYASKGISKMNNLVTFLFCIQLHVIFYTFAHQPARLVCVCIKMKLMKSNLLNLKMFPCTSGYEKQLHKMPWKKNVK